VSHSILSPRMGLEIRSPATSGVDVDAFAVQLVVGLHRQVDVRDRQGGPPRLASVCLPLLILAARRVPESTPAGS